MKFFYTIKIAYINKQNRNKVYKLLNLNYRYDCYVFLYLKLFFTRNYI